MREGYEALVRGNTEYEELHGNTSYESPAPKLPVLPDIPADSKILANLRFGDGPLLRDGTADLASGRTLKGRYIVRAGWDDVRGWFAEVRRSTVCAYSILMETCRVVLSLERRGRRHSARLKAVSRLPTI